MTAEPSNVARMLVLNGKLEMVARVSLVSTREFQAEVLPRLAKGSSWIFFRGSQIIDPKSSALMLLKGPS